MSILRKTRRKTTNWIATILGLLLALALLAVGAAGVYYLLTHGVPL